MQRIAKPEEKVLKQLVKDFLENLCDHDLATSTRQYIHPKFGLVAFALEIEKSTSGTDVYKLFFSLVVDGSTSSRKCIFSGGKSDIIKFVQSVLQELNILKTELLFFYRLLFFEL